MRAIKQPSEKVTFAYDFSDSLSSEPGAPTLAGMPVDGTPVSVPRGTGANLVQSGAAIVQDSTVLVTWDGGAAGESYLTTVKMLDTAGNKHERDGEIFNFEQGFTLPTGIESRYLTADEYVDRYGFAETVRITDEDQTRTVDKRKLEAAIKDATEIADAYIGTRYTTPLVDTPRIVKSIIGALARELLHKSRPTPEVVAAADRARGQLKDIAAGRMTLPVEQGDAVPVIGGNLLATTSDDASTSFRDQVAQFSVDPPGYLANWRR